MTTTSSGVTLRRTWAADLTAAELYSIIRLRVDVFIVEQNCPYPELDGRDLEPDTRHFWLTAHGTVVAYLRLLVDADGEFRIGRVCTAPAERGRGLSRRLLEAALAEVGTERCVLDAQTHAAGLYASLGFVRDGEEYLEDGIRHITMRRPAP